MAQKLDLTERLIALWDHLKLNSAHIATQLPDALAGFVQSHGDRVAGFAVCEASGIDPKPLRVACPTDDLHRRRHGALWKGSALGGKAPLDLLPTPKVRKNSPAVRQFTIHTWDDLVDERRAGMRALIEMLAAGKLRPRIHDHLPLADAARAHEMLESGAVLGKLLPRP